MELYIVQWCNTEEFDDMGAKCFMSLAEAELFMEHLIHLNYPKDHEGPVEYKQWKLNKAVDPEALFPYLYKLSEHRMSIEFK